MTKSVVKTDWSRAARNKRKLDLIDSAPDQTKITGYFEVIDKIFHLVNKNKILSQMFSASPTPAANKQTLSNSKTVLNQLLLNIQENANKFPTHRRHNDAIKKFATVLYIYSGSMAYEFLQQNLPEALPSLRTVQTLIHFQYTHIEEGKFQFDALMDHLQKYKAPPIIAIAEDATRIIQRVEYDPNSITSNKGCIIIKQH